jgi:hypothetical protein
MLQSNLLTGAIPNELCDASRLAFLWTYSNNMYVYVSAVDRIEAVMAFLINHRC